MNTATKPNPTIAWHKVESSQLERIGHDPETNVLAIEFKGKDDKPGSIYHYQNVDATMFAAFKGADSVGSFFYKHLKPHKDKHPYSRIPAQHAAA